jgi:hypothetical protein
MDAGADAERERRRNVMIGDVAEQEKQQSYQVAYLDMVQRYEKLALRCIEAERALSSIEGVTSQDDLIERVMKMQQALATVTQQRDRLRSAFETAAEDRDRWKASAEKAAKLVQVPEGAAIADIIKWLEGKGYRVSK